MSDDLLYIADSSSLVCTTLDGTEIFKTATGMDVNHLAVSENLVVVVGGCGADGAILVFDKVGKLRQTIETRGRPWTVVFDDACRRFACSCDNAIVSVYSCEDECHRIAQLDTNDASAFQSLAWVSDNEICTGSLNGCIAVWDVATGSQLRELQAASAAAVSRMARMANDPNMLITGHRGGIVRFWSLRDASYKENELHLGWITGMVVSEELNLVVACGMNWRLVGFDIESSEIRWQLSVTAEPSSLALHNDEVFVGLRSKPVIVLDINDGMQRRVFPRNTSSFYLAIYPSSSLHHEFHFAD